MRKDRKRSRSVPKSKTPYVSQQLLPGIAPLLSAPEPITPDVLRTLTTDEA